MKRPTWDEYFMNMVYLVASRSPDESTHIGAVIVSPNNRVISTGYNGFVSGVEHLETRQSRPLKYFFFEHAERNAIYLAEHRPVGCRMYTNGVPCADCGRAVIRAGIIEVITDKSWEKDNATKWSESCGHSYQMFAEARVRVRPIKFDIIEIQKFKRGKVI